MMERKRKDEVRGTWTEGTRPEHGRSYSAPSTDPSLNDRAAQRQSFNEFWGGVVQNRQGLAKDKFKQDQLEHTDTHSLARDKLNQQGQQWQSTFDYGKERDQVGDQQWGQKFDQGVNESDRDYGLRLGQAELGGSKWMQNPETGQLEMVQTPGVQIDRETGMPVDQRARATSLLESLYEDQTQEGSPQQPQQQPAQQAQQATPAPVELPLPPSEYRGQVNRQPPPRPFMQTNNPEFWREQRARLGAVQGKAGANRDRARQEAEERARRGMGM